MVHEGFLLIPTVLVTEDNPPVKGAKCFLDVIPRCLVEIIGGQVDVIVGWRGILLEQVEVMGRVAGDNDMV